MNSLMRWGVKLGAISLGQHLRTSPWEMTTKQMRATHRLHAVASAEPTKPKPPQDPKPNRKMALRAMFSTNAIMQDRMAGITILLPTSQLLRTSKVALGTMPNSRNWPKVSALSKSMSELARLLVMVPAKAHTGEHSKASPTATATPICSRLPASSVCCAPKAFADSTRTASAGPFTNRAVVNPITMRAAEATAWYLPFS
mmetsp:Transcript_48495/g.105603  ORF Transcript_48495/g.105603 Transcript_48495/m.105603 type:complete len:200 (-) Transcript_48495:169-768(-)